MMMITHNAFLSVQLDENGKCFFSRSQYKKTLNGTVNEKVAERKKGNEVKAGKWKHRRVWYTYLGLGHKRIRHTYFLEIYTVGHHTNYL